ncbi:MAG TPA: aldo/keto reductase [Vicinamibacteria bacterium]|jgi:aryl-alcohol dehydrogenase-like predicted oxidoreductase
MRYSVLGRTGVTVSRLALGTMTFGGESDEATAASILGRARDAGVNFIDTADVYNKGRSEEILGRLLRGHRDQVVLATKAYFPTGPDPNARGGSRYHLVRAVEASLARLSTDRIDVYYMHRFDDHTDLGDSLRALDDLVRQGKVLYPACSNFAAWQVAHGLGLAAARGLSPLYAVQPMYNLLKRQAEVEILPMARALGLGVVAYSPAAGGLLTGKYLRGARPDGARFTTNAMYQTRYGDPAYWTVADAFASLAAELGHRPATLAVAWVLSHPAVTSVLLGARSVEQLDDTLAAADLVLDDAARARVASLTPAPPPATDRSEEGGT